MNLEAWLQECVKFCKFAIYTKKLTESNIETDNILRYETYCKIT